MSDTTYEVMKIAEFAAVSAADVAIVGLVVGWNFKGNRSHMITATVAGQRRFFDIDMMTGEVWEDA